MTAESDVWACRVCRSINSRRSDRCYSCHTPRAAAAVKPGDLPTVGQAPPVVHTGTYRSSEMRAVMVTLAGAILILGILAAAYLLWQVASLRAEGKPAASEDLFNDYTPYLALVPALGVLALLTYAAWISRVVDNLPALDLGYSRVSGTMAFIEPLIPGFNLYALPARLGEVLRKLDEKGNGLPLLGLAFLLVVVPPVVAGVVLRFVVPRSFDPDRLRSTIGTLTGEFFRTAGFLGLLTATFVAMGLVIGLSLIWKVERLARIRAGEQSGKAAT